MERQRAEPEIGDRDDQHREADQILHQPGHRQEHDPLEEGKPRSPQRAVVQVERLDAPLAPTLALDEIAGQVFRRQPHRQPLVQVAGFVAFVEHRKRCQQIFRDRLGREAADRVDRLAAGDRAGTAAEAYVPAIAARRNLVEEQALLVRPYVLKAEIGLHRINVEEMLRRLDDANGAVREERQRSPEEMTVRHEVRVEDGDEIAGTDAQAIVHIAGLGMGVVVADHMNRAVVFAVGPEPVATAVIKHINSQLVLGIVERQRPTMVLSSTSSGSL